MEEAFNLHGIEPTGIVDGLMVESERTTEVERITFSPP
jgi:hypothetical protein